jgi:ABC-type lipoprotein export system ATPase subunit/capsule polysaccharide export protein KpsE/RkpR
MCGGVFLSTQSRGTEWRIWDLHVHTPASVVQHYGANDEQTWDRYISELEALPADLKVLGINDYWFLEGYRRVVAAKQSGRLQNLEAIFPVVELRLDMFSGATGPWRRVNLHVIFDPEVGADTIEQQFLNALSNEFHLAPGSEGATWSGAVTRESLEDLGRVIKENIPREELEHYGSDLQEGFNNLVVPLQTVKNLLEKSYLKGRTLVGVGRAEWAAIKWADGSIASKKTVINFADLVFTASQDISTWPSLVKDLRQSKVTHKLLDCSDAHHWSGSDQYERLGRCNTWINATPSFAGLSHALGEFDDRVFVGLEPPVLARVRRHPHHFIDQVKISSSEPTKYLHFNYEVPLNSGFVAIIGNKGQGKSALLDSIALAGNSSRTGEFAFLNPKRFLSSSGRTAKAYFAEVSWADGSTRRRGFNEGHDSAGPVQVEYLPQAFVERVCTADPKSVEDDEFEAELRSILFTHIPDDERAGELTFDSLLARRTRSVEDKLVTYRRALRRLVEDYLVSCEFRAENSLADVEAKIDKKKAEVSKAEADLTAAKASLAALESDSEEDPELTALREQAVALTGQRDVQETLLDELLAGAGEMELRLLKLNSLEQRIEAVDADAASLDAEAKALLDAGQPSSSPEGRVIELVVNRDALAEWRTQTQTAQGQNAADAKAVQANIVDLGRSLTNTTTRLASQDSVRELARQRVDQLTDRVKSLTGDAKTEGSLRGLENLRDRVAAVPATMDEQIDLMLAKAAEIHGAVVEQLDSVTSLYEPAARFIRGSKAIEQAELEFKADLRLVPTLRGLGTQIDARRSPDLPQSVIDLPSRVAARDWAEIETELRAIVGALGADRGQGGGDFRNPQLAMRNDFELAEFLDELLGMNWIEVRFGLTGGGYPLSQLSPGQRGLILALFYLVVDLRETPLLLDQPEENLDNEAISDLLVPALREAAGRRQTLVVTHNANLAVVGDADQIIHCSVVDGVFQVDSGSIADLDTAQFAVNVLEGRMPSFSKRRHKWEVFPQLNTD